jgi:HTH-type transcriptional regulator/antitoxin HigA
MLNTTKTIGKETPIFDSEAYNYLLCQYQPHLITNEEDNEKFLAIVEELMSRQTLTTEEDILLALLVKLIEDFEDKTYSLNCSTPYSRLLHLMEARSLEKVDLLNFLESKGITAQLLDGEQIIDFSQAKVLADFFQVSPNLFLSD